MKYWVYMLSPELRDHTILYDKSTTKIFPLNTVLAVTILSLTIDCKKVLTTEQLNTSGMRVCRHVGPGCVKCFLDGCVYVYVCGDCSILSHTCTYCKYRDIGVRTAYRISLSYTRGYYSLQALGLQTHLKC